MAQRNIFQLENGTFIPSINFNGSTTGIVISDYSADYTRISNNILFSLSIILSNKGSAIGDVAITGLPYTISALSPPTFSVRLANMATTLSGDISSVGNAAEIYIVKLNSGISARLTNVDFNNTSSLYISGNYKIL